MSRKLLETSPCKLEYLINISHLLKIIVEAEFGAVIWCLQRFRRLAYSVELFLSSQANESFCRRMYGRMTQSQRRRGSEL